MENTEDEGNAAVPVTLLAVVPLLMWMGALKVWLTLNVLAALSSGTLLESRPSPSFPEVMFAAFQRTPFPLKLAEWIGARSN